MKRWLICLTVCLIVFLFAGCGAESGKADCCNSDETVKNECCGQESSEADIPSDIPDCCGG